MKTSHTYRYLRAVCAVLTLLLMLSVFCVPATAVTDMSAPDASYPACYQQTDKRWADRELIGPNGCGLLALVNAVNYLTGNFIDPVPLAIYAHNIDAYNGSVGGGTARWVLYNRLQKYEKAYGFKVVQTGKDAGVKDKNFIAHLQNGGVAVCHVYGHFIAIVDYDADTKSYLVYDSAANLTSRGTTAAATWLTEKYLTTSKYMTVDWWCLIEKTAWSVNETEGKTFSDQAVPTLVRTDAEGKVRLTGSVTCSRGVSYLYYVLDYDFDHIIKVDQTLRAEQAEKLSFDTEVDLSALPVGRHTLRLSAKTADGGISDIAEYVVCKGDGSDGVDEATGDWILGFSGYLRQENILGKLSSTGYEGAIFRAAAGDVLYLGRVDLSQYDALIVTYSARNTYTMEKNGRNALVGLKSSDSSFGSVREEYNLEDVLAHVTLEPCRGLSDAHEAVIDLSGVTYDGDVYLSLYHTKNDYLFLQSLRFCRATGEIETMVETNVETETVTDAVSDVVSGTEEMSLEITDTGTEAVTASDTADGTDPSATKKRGCASFVTAPLWLVALLAPFAAAGVKRKGRTG